MKKRIILVGPAASGKDFLKKKFKKRGFKIDVSYTTRPIREGEEEGIDYKFISREIFDQNIAMDMFYEWVQHGDYLYGTGGYEWNEFDVFIMETDGIKNIKEKDRNSCFIIYLDIPQIVRQSRMSVERKWDVPTIAKRIKTDSDKFRDFVDYDLRLTNSEF